MNGTSSGKNIKGVNGSTAASGVSVDANGNTIAEHTGPYMTEPRTIQTDASVSGTAIDLIDQTSPTAANLMLQQNKIMKARVYIWLEGQDPYCIDTASTGRAFDIQINLCKPAPQQGGGT